MLSALALHNDIINTAKWDNHGSTVEQEGGGCPGSAALYLLHPPLLTALPVRSGSLAPWVSPCPPATFPPLSPPYPRTPGPPSSLPSLPAAASLHTDSYSIIFEEPEDAAKFCLQV